MFSRVEEILVIGGDFIIFLVTVYDTVYFDSHYHAFVIPITPRKSLIQIEQILDPGVLHAHVLSEGWSYITLKFNFPKCEHISFPFLYSEISYSTLCNYLFLIFGTLPFFYFIYYIIILNCTHISILCII